MNPNHVFFVLLIVSSLLSACGNVPAVPATETNIPLTPLPGTNTTPIELQSGYGVRGTWFELYFTNPASPLSPQGTGGVDGPLVAAIDAAHLSVDVAAYSLSLNSVRNALIRARDRGATVRVVMESTNMNRSDPERLIEAGIPVIGDERDGLMHDKFVIIDKSEVWLGSMNFTDGGAYEDNNNLMRIRSTKMVENYLKEFEEMFLDEKFGEEVVPETPNPTLTLEGTRLDTFFSPDDGVLALARPFIARGALAVVASLWPIRDSSASLFMFELHKRVAAGVSPMAAWRESVLAAGTQEAIAERAAFSFFMGTGSLHQVPLETKTDSAEFSRLHPRRRAKGGQQR